MGRVWLELRYKFRERSIPIAKTENPLILRVVKQDVLERARADFVESGQVDGIIAAIAQAEAEKLERILDMLIPNGDLSDR